MEDEDFKIVNLYNNELKVFRDGRVATQHIYLNDCDYKKYKKGQIKWTIKKASTDKGGYLRTALWYKGKSKMYNIHRIIGYAFLGLDIDNKKRCIDHIDHNRKNSDWLNLRIVTYQQNNFNFSNVKGYHIRKNRYEAQIKVNNKAIF